MWFVTYKSYGEWRTTSMVWDTQLEASKHAAIHLDRPDKPYITHVQIHFIGEHALAQ